VIAMVNGFAIGGGHVLHVLCDLSIAADTAVFGQTGPRVGSVDAGHGTGYLARVVGEKRAREICTSPTRRWRGATPSSRSGRSTTASSVAECQSVALVTGGDGDLSRTLTPAPSPTV